MRGGFPSRLLHKEPDDLLRIVPTYDDRPSKRRQGQLVPASPQEGTNVFHEKWNEKEEFISDTGVRGFSWR